MELELYRHDLVQSASTTRGTLVVLPIGEEQKTQKVACGDLSGVLQSFSVKRGEISMVFKTLPSSQKITSLTLGHGPNQRDRMFAAMGPQIAGYSKAGKEFFKFNTQVTEQITAVHVHEKTIWSSAEYVHNEYLEGKDKAFYLCPDRINDAQVFPLISPQEYLPVLACQDRHIRVLRGKEVVLDVPTQGAPLAVIHNPTPHDPQNRFQGHQELLYTTENGQLTQLMCDRNGTKQGFTLANLKKAGAIKAVYSGIDLTKTGVNDVVVGRDDGLFEVYDMDETGSLQQVFSTKLPESINTIDGGFVTTVNTQEVVLQTFTGKVLTYSPPGGGMIVEGMSKSMKGTQAMRAEDQERLAGYQNQISRLQGELEGLRVQVEGEKENFTKSVGSNALLAASAPFTVQDSCKLESEEACYVLNIEAGMPIFAVGIQSSISLQLLDVPSNVAIMSRSPPDEENGNLTLATYRCQDATSRLSVKFKVREGINGTLQAFIIPNVTPKTCVSVSHRIKPLCLHTRITSVDSSRPTNELVVTGTFDLADIHSWVGMVLCDVPQSASETGEATTLYYQNSLLGTQLTCKYRAGEARFTSDLITTLGILHEHLMKEATNNKHRVNVSFNPSSASLKHSVQLVWPQLEKQRTLKSKFHLLEGLEELKAQDGDVSYLAPEFKEMLDQSEAIRTQYKEQPQHLDHLISLIKDLYVDFCRLSGIGSAKQRLPALEQVLLDTRSTLDQVMDLLLGSAKN